MDGVDVEGDGFKFTAEGFPMRHLSDQSWGFRSMNLDDILRDIYSESESFKLENSGVPADGNCNITAEEVWREFPSDGAAGGELEMTLEDFLAKAGAFGTEAAIMSSDTGLPGVQFASGVGVNDGMTAAGFGMKFTNGLAAVSGRVGAGDGGRGKRSLVDVEELPAQVDKATLQKQRIMVKNRESAARSWQREKAYTMGLESQLRQLQEDNARLLKEEAEKNKARYKQLMENLIPVIEQRKPPRVMRVRSMEW